VNDDDENQKPFTKEEIAKFVSSGFDQSLVAKHYLVLGFSSVYDASKRPHFVITSSQLRSKDC
jgi:hypothetical protein